MKKTFSVLCAVPLLLCACKKADDPLLPPPPVPKAGLSLPADSAAAVQPVAAGIMVGGDQDAHGCKGSAGYQWSALKARCLRLFEEGLRLNPLTESTGATHSAFIVFAADQALAELYLPGKPVQLLQRQGEEGAQAWVAGSYRLIPWKGYVLQENGKAVYGGQ
jgi:hypothetical protein